MEPNERITQLEAELGAANAAIGARDHVIADQATRIDEITTALQRQAQKVADAHRAKNLAERHAAAVVLELAPGNVNAGELEISKQTLAKINPDTVLDLHVHTKDCACAPSDGARIAAIATPYPGRG